MALNINLYVHGVPMGHKTWGVLGEDDNFIANFYSFKWPAKELMQVDIMECKGKVYSYYTFVKGQNVMGYDNRTKKCALGDSFKNKEKASSSLFKTSLCWTMS